MSPLFSIRSRFAFLAALTFASPASAHLLLSENVEVYLDDPASVRVEFTIHAPELPAAVAAGVDPAAVDATWLAGLDDGTIATLTREAETFIRDTFLVRKGENDALAGIAIAFDDPESIRRPPDDTKLPPGCLLGTAILANPGNTLPFSIGFAPDAQKRLLLSIARPGAFPRVHDIAPGENVAVVLPDPPAPPPIEESSPSPAKSEQLPQSGSSPHHPLPWTLALTCVLIAIGGIATRLRHR